MCWNTGLPNSLKYCNITAITPFRVTDFGTNRKFIYDSLLVINTDLPLILHRFQVMDGYYQIFTSERGLPHFNTLAGGDPLPVSP